MCTGRENDNWIIFELDDDEEDDYDYDDDDRSTSVIRAERRLRGERWREARFTPADIEVVAPTFHVNHISTHARTRSRTLFVYPVTALMNSKIEPLRVTHPSSSLPSPSFSLVAQTSHRDLTWRNYCRLVFSNLSADIKKFERNFPSARRMERIDGESPVLPSDSLWNLKREGTPRDGILANLPLDIRTFIFTR